MDGRFDPLPLRSPIVAGAASDKRRSRRMKVFMPIEVTMNDVTMRAHLLDVSMFGTLMHTGTQPRPGSIARVKFNDDCCSAKVVWVGAGRVGLQFHKALTPAQVAMLLGS